MKIMWFTNVPLPAVKEHFGIKTFGSGSWLSALLNIIKNTNNTFTIVCTYPIKNVLFFKHENVKYYVIPETNDIKDSKIKKSLFQCIKIIQSVKPDIIHIHGTERFYGLLSVRNNINIPTIISIQGIVQVYAEWYRYFGNNTLTDIIKMHRIVEPFFLKGEFFKYLKFKKRVKIESEIFRGNNNFIGRTNWDQAVLKKNKP